MGCLTDIEVWTLVRRYRDGAVTTEDEEALGAWLFHTARHALLARNYASRDAEEYALRVVTAALSEIAAGQWQLEPDAIPR